jgi:hypothetical protein
MTGYELHVQDVMQFEDLLFKSQLIFSLLCTVCYCNYFLIFSKYIIRQYYGKV